MRKIDGLFDSCIESYRRLKNINGKINPVISITVSNENCEDIEKIYEFLSIDMNIESIKCTIVRDEGILNT